MTIALHSRVRKMVTPKAFSSYLKAMGLWHFQLKHFHCVSKIRHLFPSLYLLTWQRFQLENTSVRVRGCLWTLVWFCLGFVLSCYLIMGFIMFYSCQGFICDFVYHVLSVVFLSGMWVLFLILIHVSSVFMFWSFTPLTRC